MSCFFLILCYKTRHLKAGWGWVALVRTEDSVTPVEHHLSQFLWWDAMGACDQCSELFSQRMSLSRIAEVVLTSLMCKYTSVRTEHISLVAPVPKVTPYNSILVLTFAPCWNTWGSWAEFVSHSGQGEASKTAFGGGCCETAFVWESLKAKILDYSRWGMWLEAGRAASVLVFPSGEHITWVCPKRQINVAFYIVHSL